MSNGPDIHELARQQAVLEERMKTMQAEYRTDIARLAEYMATSQSDLREDMAKRDTEAAKRDTDSAKRDKDNLRWVVGFGIAQTVLTLTVLAAGFAFIGLLVG